VTGEIKSVSREGFASSALFTAFTFRRNITVLLPFRCIKIIAYECNYFHRSLCFLVISCQVALIGILLLLLPQVSYEMAEINLPQKGTIDFSSQII